MDLFTFIEGGPTLDEPLISYMFRQVNNNNNNNDNNNNRYIVYMYVYIMQAELILCHKDFYDMCMYFALSTIILVTE